MPANRGASPNWNPPGSITARNNITPAEPTEHYPASVEAFAVYLCGLGLPELDSYDQVTKRELAQYTAEQYYVAGCAASQLVMRAFFNEQTSQSTDQPVLTETL